MGRNRSAAAVGGYQSAVAGYPEATWELLFETWSGDVSDADSTIDCYEYIDRLAVPGGWLYRTTQFYIWDGHDWTRLGAPLVTMVFVPTGAAR